MNSTIILKEAHSGNLTENYLEYKNNLYEPTNDIATQQTTNKDVHGFEIKINVTKKMHAVAKRMFLNNSVART